MCRGRRALAKKPKVLRRVVGKLHHATRSQGSISCMQLEENARAKEVHSCFYHWQTIDYISSFLGRRGTLLQFGREHQKSLLASKIAHAPHNPKSRSCSSQPRAPTKTHHCSIQAATSTFYPSVVCLCHETSKRNMK